MLNECALVVAGFETSFATSALRMVLRQIIDCQSVCSEILLVVMNFKGKRGDTENT